MAIHTLFLHTVIYRFLSKKLNFLTKITVSCETYFQNWEVSMDTKTLLKVCIDLLNTADHKELVEFSNNLHNDLQEKVRNGHFEDIQALSKQAEFVKFLVQYKSGKPNQEKEQLLQKTLQQQDYIDKLKSVIEKYKILENFAKKLVETQALTRQQKSSALDEKLKEHLQAITKIRSAYYNAPKSGFLGWLCQGDPQSSYRFFSNTKNRENQIANIEMLAQYLQDEMLDDMNHTTLNGWLLSICKTIGIQYPDNQISQENDQFEQENLIRLSKSLLLLGILIKTEKDIEQESNLATSRLKTIITHFKKPLIFDISTLSNNTLHRNEVIEKAEAAYQAWVHLKHTHDNSMSISSSHSSSGNKPTGLIM